MARMYRLSMMALILLVVWGCVKSGSPEGQGQPLPPVDPMQHRFTKVNHGVITDSVTGLDWYVGPNHDNNWHQAKAGRRVSPWPGAAGGSPPFRN